MAPRVTLASAKVSRVARRGRRRWCNFLIRRAQARTVLVPPFPDRDKRTTVWSAARMGTNLRCPDFAAREPTLLLVANLKTDEIRAKNRGGKLPVGGEVTRQLGFPRRGRDGEHARCRLPGRGPYPPSLRAPRALRLSPDRAG